MQRTADVATLEDHDVVARLAREGSRYHAFPLSFAQERLWMLDRLAPGTSTYNVAVAVRLIGKLQVDRLVTAFRDVVRRHEVLRTRFVDIGGTPVQLVDPPGELPIPAHDIEHLAAAGRLSEARRLATTEAARPFDLRDGALFRVCLIRLDSSDHILLIVLHHIISDAWSIDVLLNEVCTMYRRHAADGEAALAPLPLQYGDYAAWERQRLHGERLRIEIAYWRDRLRGASPYLRFPGNRCVAAPVANRGTRVRLDIPVTLAANAISMARRADISLFMLLAACLAGLVCAWTGESRVVMVTSVANRDRPELESLMGPFLNLVPLRIDIAPRATWGDLLPVVRESVLSAFAHRHLPFERLIQGLGIPREGSRPPFTRLGLVLNTAVSASAIELPELRAQRFPIDVPTPAKADLMLCMSQSAGGLDGTFEFDPDAIDPETVTALAAGYAAMLDAIVKHPESPVAVPATQGDMASPIDTTARNATLFERSNLSAAQLRYWIGQRMAPDVPLYNMAGVFTIDGPVDRLRFEQAYDMLLRSSDALSTAFQEVDGIPRQVLVSGGERLKYLDLSSEPDPSASVREWAASRARSLFTLSTTPLESALVRLGSDRFAWYVCVHQLVADALSTMLMFRRIREFYEAGPAALVTCPRFADYIEHEKSRREAPGRRRHEAFWKRWLSDPPPRALLYGRAASGAPLRARRTSVALNDRQAAALNRLAASAGKVGTADLGMFGVAAALVVDYVQRASGCHALMLGMTRHDRSSRRFAETIGMFADVVPLHLHLSADSSLLTVARLVIERALDSMKHGAPPIDQAGGRAFCDVVFNYINAPVQTFDGHAVSVDWIHSGFQRESLVVHLRRVDSCGRLVFELDWNCEVADHSTVEIATEQFAHLVDQELTVASAVPNAPGADGGSAFDL